MAEQPKPPTKKPDDLTKTEKPKDVELKEDELGRVTGGAIYIKYADQDKTSG